MNIVHRVYCRLTAVEHDELPRRLGDAGFAQAEVSKRRGVFRFRAS